MAEIKQVQVLDQKLMQDGSIDEKYGKDYLKVHKELNAIARRSGGILDETHLEKGEKALREWLHTLYKQGASQEKLTSYLRCGLAHLCYDLTASNYSRIEPGVLLTRSLMSFKKRGYQKSYYKPLPGVARKTNTVKKTKS
jgi:hypothetical protein